MRTRRAYLAVKLKIVHTHIAVIKANASHAEINRPRWFDTLSAKNVVIAVHLHKLVLSSAA
jgi:hypothetical protein